MSLQFDDFDLNLDRYELRRGSESIALEPQAFEVLAHLIENRERVVTKEELFEAVWDTHFVSDSALTTRIKEVRRALGDDGRTQRYVRTVRGRGYHFAAEATEVGARAATGVGATEATGVAASPPGDGSAPLDAVAPRSEVDEADGLVGRSTELERLHSAADRAIAGRGGVALLVGEAGIGKTRMAQELEAYAELRGALVLWGRVRQGAGAPPYYPWIQIGTGYARTADLATLDLGSHTDDLMRLMPELASTPPGLEAPAAATEGAATQFRMFEAFTAFLRAASQNRPLVLVLDDLHWADGPTLLLLQHLSPDLDSMPVLVIGTYRDTDVGTKHPLTPVLAQLNREPGFQRTKLDGLSESEVEDYVRRHSPVELGPPLVHDIRERTEGNPFFVSQMVQLISEGRGDDPAADRSRAAIDSIALPDGIREALSVRLERLSPPARTALHVGAVCGRTFDLATITAAMAEPNAPVLDLIEEALAAHVIEDFEEPGRYRFVHALMQETLLDELSATRRARTHGAVADALEASAGAGVDGEAPRLAHHFAESARLDNRHARQTVHYSLLAAAQAEARSAWDEAALLYERCMTFAETDAEVDIDRSVARLALGRCYHYSGAQRAAWRNLLTASDEFQKREEWELAAEAVGLASEISAPPSRQVELITGLLDAAGGSASNATRATLLTKRSMLRVASGASPEDTEDDAEEATALLGELDLPLVEALLNRREAGKARRFAQGPTVFPLLTRTAEQFERAGNLDETSEAMWGAANELLRVGPVDGIHERLHELLEYTQRRRLGRWAHLARYALARLAVLEARREDARQMIEEMDPAGGTDYYPAMARAAVAELDVWPANLDDLLPSPEATGGDAFQLMAVHASRLRTFVFDGQLDAARAEWERGLSLVTDHSHQPGGIYPTGMYAAMGDALPDAVDADQLPPVYEYLTQGPTVVAGFSGSMNNVRGRIALKLDRLDDAERQLEAALEWTETAGWPVDGGRAHQALADLWTRRGDEQRAASHRVEAAGRFDAHGAEVFLRELNATAPR